MNYKHIGAVLALALLLAGCLMGPNYKQPDLDLPTGEAADNFSIFTNVKWWEVFEDPTLNELENTALTYNKDLQAAVARVDEARAAVGIATADQLPSLSAAGQSGRAGNNLGSGESQSTANVSVSFELDLWGKYRDSYSAAGKAYEASIYDFESARLSIISSVVKLYFNAINLNNQVEVLIQTVEDYTTSYELKQSQHRVGAISEYELYNYKAQLESARAQLTTLKAARDSNNQALMILVSSDLNEILYATLPYTKIENFKVELPQGISSEILLQRPDIRAALARLEQKNYLVGVARTAYLPSISLTGLLGFQSTELSKLAQGNSVAWNAGASALMPIFRWGEITYNVNLAKLAKDEAYLNYESVLKTAFGEVRTALVQRESAFMNEKNYADLLDSQEKIYNLAQIRYNNGSSSLTDLLNARQSYLNAKLNYENSVYSLLSSVVDIIKAFGGGFNAKDDIELNIKQEARSLDMKFRD